ncbi:MAG: hypothetical protein GY757_61150, partial [bacterium]|nr:hypothetical protein [bacterium]
DLEFAIQHYHPPAQEQTKEHTDKILANFIRPFELSKAPLFRAGLIKLDTLQKKEEKNAQEEKYILMVDMHHIVTDGTSMEILTRDFATLYRDKNLPPVPFQYKDYAQWRNSKEQKKQLEEQEKYWLRQLRGEIAQLRLPLDYPRPTLRSSEGRETGFQLPEKENEKLGQLARKEDVTMFMLLLAIYNVMLYKITGQENILVGTVNAGRQHADLENILGMFVNTLVLRNRPHDDMTFRQFLAEVKTQAAAAFDNQDYPFEDLVEKILPNRDVARNPIFDTMFVHRVRNTQP